jgi:hypothetical protein
MDYRCAPEFDATLPDCGHHRTTIDTSPSPNIRKTTLRQPLSLVGGSTIPTFFE